MSAILKMNIIKLHAMVLLSIALTGCLVTPIPYKGYPHKQIEGRILDKKTRRPVVGAKVHLAYMLAGHLFINIDISEAESDSNGYFVVEPIRHWNVLVLFFGAYSHPFFDRLSISKDHYEDFGMHLDQNDQSGFAGNYCLFKRKYDVGEILLSPIAPGNN